MEQRISGVRINILCDVRVILLPTTAQGDQCPQLFWEEIGRNLARPRLSGSELGSGEASFDDELGVFRVVCPYGDLLCSKSWSWKTGQMV